MTNDDASKKPLQKSQQKPPVPGVLSARECFEKHLTAARGLDSTAVDICRADAAVVFSNVKSGVGALTRAGDDEVRWDAARWCTLLPMIEVGAALGAGEVARALVYAVSIIPADAGSDGQIALHQGRVRKHREPMLSSLETMAGKNILPVAVPQGIRANSGPFDEATDGLALVRVYTVDYATALSGKHPFTPKDFAELAESSEFLLDHLTPTGARRQMAVKSTEAEDLRNRLWAILQPLHSDLRLMGFYRYRDAFDEYVPKLQSRVAPSASAATDTSTDTTETQPAVTSDVKPPTA